MLNELIFFKSRVASFLVWLPVEGVLKELKSTPIEIDSKKLLIVAMENTLKYASGDGKLAPSDKGSRASY